MDSQSNPASLQDALSKAKNILILCSSLPTIDGVAAGLALYLSLKKQEKQVSIACSSPMTVAFNHLVGVNKITDRIGNRNLVVSFNYLKDAIEKVSYNIENDKFNLVVEPRVGYPPLNSDQVSYSYTGTEADLIFIIGCPRYEDLGKIYFQEKKIFETATTVNLDNKLINAKYAKINLLDLRASSCSEIVTNFLRKLGIPFDQDMATNLLTGIISATNNFQAANTTPQAFEAAAFCLSNGAKREFLTSPQPSQTAPVAAPQLTSPVTNPYPFPFGPASQPVPVTNKPVNPANINSFDPTQPPPDWLKPKIYKGSSIV